MKNKYVWTWTTLENDRPTVNPLESFPRMHFLLCITSITGEQNRQSDHFPIASPADQGQKVGWKHFPRSHPLLLTELHHSSHYPWPTADQLTLAGCPALRSTGAALRGSTSNAQEWRSSTTCYYGMESNQGRKKTHCWSWWIVINRFHCWRGVSSQLCCIHDVWNK